MTGLQKHIAYHNKNTELNFRESDHRYFDDDNKTYTSVTQFLGEFEAKFDKEYWGMYTALKDNKMKVKPDVANRAIIVNGKHCKLADLHKDRIYKHYYTATIAKWAAITEEALFRGNNTHNYLEETINKSKGFTSGQGEDNYRINHVDKKSKVIETLNDLESTDLGERFPSIYDRLRMFIDKDCIIYAEKKLKLDLVQLAGTIDVPIIKRGTNKFCILDWKTNKDEFQSTSGYFRKIQVGGIWIKSDEFVPTDDKLAYPLGHIPACKLNGYFLQLSLYAYMMECWGYELVNKGLEIMHIRPGLEPKLIKVPYLRDDIELIIKHRLRELGIPYFNKETMQGE